MMMPWAGCWTRRLAVLGVLAAAPCWAQGPAAAKRKGEAARFEVPPVGSIKRIARPGGLNRDEAMQSRYILKTEPHPALGEAYVVVTDHRDEAYLAPLQRLARHHEGTIVRVDDLGALAQAPARAGLITQLKDVKAGYVAVAPRNESFRENMLLGLWSVLAKLDADPELDARPGLLVAPDARSFAGLIDRSIAHRPVPRTALRPFVVSQLGNASPNGTRSLQKLGVMRELFGGMGFEAPGLVVRQFPGDEPRLEGRDIWVARTSGPRLPLAEFPEPASRAFDEASLVVMFGHGTPGITCGMKVESFDHRSFAGKVVLCGSCMSAAPAKSDWPAMAVGPDGMAVVAGRKRFLSEAVERGAVVTYAHMRLNAGFPHLFPVLESLLRGETVGDAYQELIDGLRVWTRLDPDEFVLRAVDAGDQTDVMRRNQMLYVMVGDPKLRPLAPLETAGGKAKSPRGGTD